MNYTNFLAELRTELHSHSDEATRLSGKRFFKEEVKLYGIKTAMVSTIAKQYYKKIFSLPKLEIYSLCESLWKSGYLEESFIACNWSYALRKQYDPNEVNIFELWIDKYVNNWASCDTLCNHTIGTYIELYPEHITSLLRWTKSPNRWMRRAAAVTLIIPARHGKFLKEIFAIADKLLFDDDDLVQKGYGWMLKAASKTYTQEVFDYVQRHKVNMPRTALRYAIEKMPVELRKQAMEK